MAVKDATDTKNGMNCASYWKMKAEPFLGRYEGKMKA